MDYVLGLLKDIQIAQLVAIGIMLWLFYNRLNEKIQHLEGRLNNVENRLSIIETILSMMGAPMKGFKNPKTDP